MILGCCLYFWFRFLSILFVLCRNEQCHQAHHEEFRWAVSSNRDAGGDQIQRCGHGPQSERKLSTVHRVNALLFYPATRSIGNCKMLDRPTAFGNVQCDVRLLARISEFCGQGLRARQAFSFRRARLEVEIFVCPDGITRTTCRHETIVMKCAGVLIRVAHLVGVVNADSTEIFGTFVCRWRMGQPVQLGAIPQLGTKSVKLSQIFCLNKWGGGVLVSDTRAIDRQMRILGEARDTEDLLVSPPSNRFRPT